MFYNLIAFTFGTFIGVFATLVVARALRKGDEQFSEEEVRSLTKNDWTDLATGESGYLEIEKAWLRNAQMTFALFCKKQHDYGCANIALGGLPGVTIRLGDKMSRLWELTGMSAAREGETSVQKHTLVSETLVDTLQDITNYAIISTIVLDGGWPKLTPKDAWT